MIIYLKDWPAADARGDDRLLGWIRAEHPHEEIYAPDFSYDAENPWNVLHILIGRIKLAEGKGDDVTIFAAGIGGFFGYVLNRTFPFVNAVLFDPILAPYITLRNRFGIARSRCEDYFAIFYKYNGFESGQTERLHIYYSEGGGAAQFNDMTLPFLPIGFTNLSPLDMNISIGD